MKTASKKPSRAESSESRLPLQGWSLEFARRWNAGTYSLFVLHGNIFDLFPVQGGPGFVVPPSGGSAFVVPPSGGSGSPFVVPPSGGSGLAVPPSGGGQTPPPPTAGKLEYVPLKTFLVRRLFAQRACLLFYDISDGLSFGSADMQKQFFQWLEIYDHVEHTNFHRTGPPREFVRLAPLLRRFFLNVAEEKEKWPGITLIIDFPEKLIPAMEEASASNDERMNLVTFLKWAAAPEMARLDIGVILVAESAAELNARLLQNPYVAQVRIDLPDAEERLRFLKSGLVEELAGKKSFAAASDFTPEILAARTAGLNLLRIRHLLAEALRNGMRVTHETVSAGKKRLIEEYCQGLVRFKDPKPGVSLDRVATHTAAKQRLRELAWLIKNAKTEVLERGILVPGRVGVGKSFLIDCFASECGLPVMEMGEFRSKWVGDTERQQMRILLTIRALGPVIVVVDEADAVFGTRDAGGDSGVSGRVFAAFAAHIGDSTLRGREMWVAMTSRPDLLSIDMKRQGRFGLCIPLFPAQTPEDVADLFTTIAKVKNITLIEPLLAYIRSQLGHLPLTGSDTESILIRAKERAVLEKRDTQVQQNDLEAAVGSFIDPLDPDLLALQELAAVLACSDRRYLPPAYSDKDRALLREDFARLKLRLGRG